MTNIMMMRWSGRLSLEAIRPPLQSKKKHCKTIMFKFWFALKCILYSVYLCMTLLTFLWLCNTLKYLKAMPIIEKFQRNRISFIRKHDAKVTKREININAIIWKGRGRYRLIIVWESKLDSVQRNEDNDYEEKFIVKLPFDESFFLCIHKLLIFPYILRTFCSNNARFQNFQRILTS